MCGNSAQLMIEKGICLRHKYINSLKNVNLLHIQQEKDSCFAFSLSVRSCISRRTD